jgi:hypothetical protein
MDIFTGYSRAYETGNAMGIRNGTEPASVTDSLIPLVFDSGEHPS